ncbi:uncharacterized protein [Periplaneta americana]|uniref:uncharacterized protein n=1 Tax=Periplaneta americana TaxID=6978 RepID=UPI0037E86A8A
MAIIWKPLTLLFLVLASNAVDYPDYWPQLRRSVQSFNKLLDYMLQSRTGSVVGDMILGVVLARGQLAVMKEHLLQSPTTKKKLSDLATISLLQNKCEEIFQKYMPIRIEDKREAYNLIMDHVIKEELWEVDYPITVGKLRELPKKSVIKKRPNGKPPKLTKRQVLAFLFSGHPSEMESDNCISLLISPTKCGTSNKCWDIMSNKDEKIHGYPLTHRLLYLQIARQLECENRVEFSHIQESIKDLCSDILVEQNKIVELGIPKGFRDLFLEQITLCGIEGFAEFLNPLYVDTILPLQTPSGCFADEISDSWLDALNVAPSGNRVKRDDGSLEEDGCTMHITGLATSFLALSIRSIVEFWNPLIHIPSVVEN